MTAERLLARVVGLSLLFNVAPACQRDASKVRPVMDHEVSALSAGKGAETMSPKGSRHRLVSVRALRDMLQSPQHPVIIDVRDAARFNRWRIPRSIHRPAWQLETSSSVRAGDPVVVDEGLGSGPLAAVLDTLAAQGLRLRMLDGGMAAWCRAGGPTTAPCVDADVISPPELIGTMDCSGRRLIVALKTTHPEPDELQAQKLPERLQRTTVVRWDRASELMPRVRDAAQGAKQILVMDRNGSRIGALREGLKDSARPVFFVRGGLAAVIAHMRRHPATKSARRVLNHGVVQHTGSPRGFTTPAGECGCL